MQQIEAQVVHQQELDPVNVALKSSEQEIRLEDKNYKSEVEETITEQEVLIGEANAISAEGHVADADASSVQLEVKPGETVDDKVEGVECEAETGDETVFPEDYQPAPDDEFEVMDAVGEDVDADDRKGILLSEAQMLY